VIGKKRDHEASTLSQSSSEEGKRVTRGAAKKLKQTDEQPKDSKPKEPVKEEKPKKAQKK
jgi:hypothetical protein